MIEMAGGCENDSSTTLRRTSGRISTAALEASAVDEGVEEEDVSVETAASMAAAEISSAAARIVDEVVGGEEGSSKSKTCAGDVDVDVSLDRPSLMILRRKIRKEGEEKCFTSPQRVRKNF